MLTLNTDRHNTTARVIQLKSRRDLKPATLASFPVDEPTQQPKPTFSNEMLEWLDEADYNWADAPATF